VYCSAAEQAAVSENPEAAWRGTWTWDSEGRPSGWAEGIPGVYDRSGSVSYEAGRLALVAEEASDQADVDSSYTWDGDRLAIERWDFDADGSIEWTRLFTHEGETLVSIDTSTSGGGEIRTRFDYEGGQLRRLWEDVRYAGEPDWVVDTDPLVFEYDVLDCISHVYQELNPDIDWLFTYDANGRLAETVQNGSFATTIAWEGGDACVPAAVGWPAWPAIAWGPPDSTPSFFGPYCG
jgi:hypothetical protein